MLNRRLRVAQIATSMDLARRDAAKPWGRCFFSPAEVTLRLGRGYRKVSSAEGIDLRYSTGVH